MSKVPLGAREEVLNTARDMLRKGLVTGTSGNCSIRLGEADLVLITPSSIEYDLMLPEDICVVNMAGEQVEGKNKPSIEINMHLAIYAARQDVSGIVHTHQLIATAVSVAGKRIPPIMEEQVFKVRGAVELAKYALPGTSELAANALEALGERNACLLPHHGVVAVGEKMSDALFNAEVVERAALAFVLSELLGGSKVIPFMEAQEAQRNE